MDNDKDKELDADEAARASKAEALGIEQDAPLLSGLNMGFGEEPPAPDAVEQQIEATPAAPADEIVIGDKVFTSKEDALAYAKQLQNEKEATDAYRQGLQDALAQQQGNPAAPTAAEPDNFDEEFYADPKKLSGWPACHPS